MNFESNPDKRVGAGRPSSAFARIERLPPLLIGLYLALGASSVLFLVLVVAYASTRAHSGLPPGLYPFPRYFSLSTIVLLLSSYTIGQAPRLYAQDDLASLGRCLGATLLLGCVFAGLQVLGWRELDIQGMLFRGKASGTFVYLITGLHVAHLAAGLLAMLALLVQVLHANRDAVRALVFIRNPYHRRQLRALATYWHFVDVVWVVLFAVFLFLY
jgi:cytochrome c oxidase subunit 3